MFKIYSPYAYFDVMTIVAQWGDVCTVNLMVTGLKSIKGN